MMLHSFLSCDIREARSISKVGLFVCKTCVIFKVIYDQMQTDVT